MSLQEQQQFANQHQFSPKQQTSLEESVHNQQLSHDQFLTNNRHRLFTQFPQQQQFQKSPRLGEQLFSQQRQQF